MNIYNIIKQHVHFGSLWLTFSALSIWLWILILLNRKKQLKYHNSLIR